MFHITPRRVLFEENDALRSEIEDLLGRIARLVKGRDELLKDARDDNKNYREQIAALMNKSNELLESLKVSADGMDDYAKKLEAMRRERNKIMEHRDEVVAKLIKAIKSRDEIRRKRDTARQEHDDVRRANKFLTERIADIKTNFDSANDKLNAVENALS